MHGFSVGMPVASDRLEPFYPILPVMGQLKTFSLNLQNDAARTYLFLSTIIAKLLQYLPHTVMNLGLDTAGLDGIPKHDHLCGSISKLIPQLHYLRLRVSSLCAELMSSLRHFNEEPDRPSSLGPVSQLRVAIIRLEIEPGNSQGPLAVCDCEHISARRFNPSLFAQNIFQLHEAGAFPHIQHFILVNKIGRSNPTRHGSHDYFTLRDIAQNCTTTFPCLPLQQYSSRGVPWLRFPYLIRNHQGEDLIGDREEISALLEGHLSWTELPNGSRLPPKTTKPVDKNHQLITASLLRRSTVVENCFREPQLWEREEIIGSPILRARTCDGIEEGIRAQEELPECWRFFYNRSTGGGSYLFRRSSPLFVRVGNFLQGCRSIYSLPRRSMIRFIVSIRSHGWFYG
ncbi:hypothetical protein AOQ84DRAFT_87341 [Glonium stellatum]|uniref:Uncharacterized protein n=1 Tax=Glonium stellatum TaxID=574774 RepID=A0A8E2JQK8_9PEZI|nr:hypothetical protein AOQ84DRAFT_87341 [Glonium stellatum]